MMTATRTSRLKLHLSELQLFDLYISVHMDQHYVFTIYTKIAVTSYFQIFFLFSEPSLRGRGDGGGQGPFSNFFF